MKNQASESTATEAAESQSKKSPPKFTVAQMRPNCMALFGVTVSTYDGATFGLDSKDKFTVEGMKAKIEGWKKAKPFRPQNKGGKTG